MADIGGNENNVSFLPTKAFSIVTMVHFTFTDPLKNITGKPGTLEKISQMSISVLSKYPANILVM